MLAEAFSVVLQLPPLAFGPSLPPTAFAPPAALTCPIRELGRIQEPSTPRLVSFKAPIDPHSLTPPPERFLVNRPVDILLFLAAAYAGRASWEDRPASARFWQATGAVAPVLIPPMASPPWTMQQQ